jgi:hypothetical protein
MTDTTKKAMTLEDVRDWMRRLEKQHDLIPPLREAYGSAADAIDAHLAAQREGEASEMVSIPKKAFDWLWRYRPVACRHAGVPRNPPHPRVEVTDEMVERLAKYIYAQEARKCSSLEEFERYNKNWPRAIPEAKAMLIAALSEKGDGQP